MIAIVVADGLGGGGAHELVIARAAVREGGPVEVLGRVPEGPAGDAAVLALAREGIGHAALLRVAAGADTLEPVDLELALGYLPAIRVLVVSGDAPPLLAVAGAAADWHGAQLVVVVDDRDMDLEATLPRTVCEPLVLVRPVGHTGAFDDFVGRVAARIDRGALVDVALTEVEAAVLAERVRP